MNKTNTKRVVFDFPIDLLKEVDAICKESFITRRKWFIDAAQDKLDKENLVRIDKIVNK